MKRSQFRTEGDAHPFFHPKFKPGELGPVPKDGEPGSWQNVYRLAHGGHSSPCGGDHHCQCGKMRPGLKAYCPPHYEGERCSMVDSAHRKDAEVPGSKK